MGGHGGGFFEWVLVGLLVGLATDQRKDEISSHYRFLPALQSLDGQILIKYKQTLPFFEFANAFILETHKHDSPAHFKNAINKKNSFHDRLTTKGNDLCDEENDDLR